MRGIKRINSKKSVARQGRTGAEAPQTGLSMYINPLPNLTTIFKTC